MVSSFLQLCSVRFARGKVPVVGSLLVLEAVFQTGRFFQQISGLLEPRQIIFGNMINVALENSTN